MYFDIGSNIGLWSLANINSADKIITIEASPSTFYKLQSNCMKYIMRKKIIALNYAVCNNDGKDIKFYECDGCDLLSSMNKEWFTSEDSRFYNYKYKEIVCKTISIDKLIKMYGVPELIKIDVEGGEYECIISLTQKVNMLCFEWAGEVNHITFKCLDYLLQLGFTKFSIQISDNYTFRPSDDMFYDIDKTKAALLEMKPKVDWGMLWCK